MFPLVVILALLSQAAPIPAEPIVPSPSPVGPARPAPGIVGGVNKDAIHKIEVGRADVSDKWFAIEYLGHFDDKKKFIYNRARLLVAPAVAGEILNYGLDSRQLGVTPPGVRGNDAPFRKRIEADVESIGAKKFETAVKPCGAIHEGPCPGPNCPKPEKPREPILPFPDPFRERRDPWDHLVPVLIAVAATVIVSGGFLLFAGGILYLLLRKKPPGV